MSPELQTAFGEAAVAQPEFVVGSQASEVPQNPIVIPDLREFNNESWTRTQISVTFNGTEHQMTGAQSGSLIMVRKFQSVYNNSVTDTSIRMRSGDTSYILRYDSDEDYKAWELIKSVPANGSGPQGAEQAIFKHRTADPDMVIDDTAIPEWQRIRENLSGLLSSLPDEYPEKSELQEIWAPLTLTSVTEERLAKERRQMEYQKALHEEKQRRIEEFNRQFTPKPKNLLQKAADAVTKPFRDWKANRPYRKPSRPSTGSYHERQYYMRSNSQ